MSLLLVAFWECGSLAGTASGQPARRPILIVTALDYEFDAAVRPLTSARRSRLAGRTTASGYLGQIPVVVIRSGWGKIHAAGATAATIQRYKPSLVLMAGVGGGIDPRIATSGDVVVSTATFQYDLGELANGKVTIWDPETPLENTYPSAAFQAPERLVGAVLTALRPLHLPSWTLPEGCSCDHDGRPTRSCTGKPRLVGRERPRICAGVIATGDAFVVDRSFAAALLRGRKSVALDMETAAVAEEAADQKVPFMAIRVISDTVNTNGEGLYYCLKPMSGARLSKVIEHALPALQHAIHSAPGRSGVDAADLCLPETAPTGRRRSEAPLLRPEGPCRKKEVASPAAGRPSSDLVETQRIRR